MRKPAVNAPELHTNAGWVNITRPLSLQDLKGKIVLLDFWTFGCINCQHNIPDLIRLEKEYGEELVVIGVHSGKFNAEKNSGKIKEAIEKFGIHHPVINDADYKLWDAYAVRAWPTTVLISPAGKVIGQHAGEGVYKVLKPHLDRLLSEDREFIKKRPLPMEINALPRGVKTLHFPSRIISSPDGNLWCADSGNNRILKISPDGKILLCIGNGSRGFSNGPFNACSFNEPHGMALDGNLLYIADTKNNAIRVADLDTRKVSTLSGTGELDYYFFFDRQDEEVLPNSPWDLLIQDGSLYIASAGNHQLLRMNLKERIVKRFAGTGREALGNGKLLEASFNQPSGLSIMKNTLLVADAEASAVRAIDLEEHIVYTPLGKGLFHFGDVDGAVEDALLQHPMAVKYFNGLIYIADTYNGKIKVFDLDKERVKTVIAGLNEPNDMLFIRDELWVCDTNNHQILKVNLKTLKKESVNVKW